MAPSPLLVSYLTILLEAFFIGIYGVLVALVIQILTAHRRAKGAAVQRFFFGASIFMFLISVTHIGLEVQNFTGLKPKEAKINSLVQLSLATVQFIAGDLVLIWRVWLVWGRHYYIAAFPTVLLCVNVGLNVHFAVEHGGGKNINLISIGLTLVSNFVCTALIAGKIIYVRYQLNQSFFGSKNNHSGGYMRALMLIIESGIGNSFVQITALVLTKYNSPGRRIILASAIPLVGIFPTLIIIFVHYKKSLGDQTITDRVNAQASTMKFEAGKSMKSGTNSAHIPLSTVGGSGGQMTVISISGPSDSEEWKTPSRDYPV